MVSLRNLADISPGLVRAGRGAGARRGDWRLWIVESRDVRGRWLARVYVVCTRLRSSEGVRTERHLLRPFDVLVTARAGSAQIALVPPGVSRTVAAFTLLVVRPKEPEAGMGHWLWYYLTSTQGRAQLARRMTVSATVVSLSAQSLGEIEVPVPSRPELDAVARLVEASEAAYTAAVDGRPAAPGDTTRRGDPGDRPPGCDGNLGRERDRWR